MFRKLFVSFEQPEKITGRLTVYIDKEKVCTLKNHQVFESAPLSSEKHVIRAVFGPSRHLLPLARRNVINSEHALGAWIMRKHIMPEGAGDLELSFSFVVPEKNNPGKAVFDFHEYLPVPEEKPELPKKRDYFRSPFCTDTGKDMIRILYPPAYPGDITFSKALELPYTLIGYVSCDAMGGQRDLEFAWEYLCRDPADESILLREFYNVSTDGSDPADIQRKHLYRIEAETLTKAKEAECRRYMIPAENLTVHLPVSLCEEVRNAVSFNELYDFSHQADHSVLKSEDHIWKITVTKDDIHPADTCGPFTYELDDRMTVSELLKYTYRNTLAGYSAWDWEVRTCEGTLGYIKNSSLAYEPCVQDVSLKEADIRNIHCRCISH